jgi:hypothetical protein
LSQVTKATTFGCTFGMALLMFMLVPFVSFHG